MKGLKTAYNSLVNHETWCSDSTASPWALLYICNPTCAQSHSTAAILGVIPLSPQHPTSLAPALTLFLCLSPSARGWAATAPVRHHDSTWNGKRDLKLNLPWQTTETIKTSDMMCVRLYRNHYKGREMQCYPAISAQKRTSTNFFGTVLVKN